jgi:hypothetical protein
MKGCHSLPDKGKRSGVIADSRAPRMIFQEDDSLYIDGLKLSMSA